MRNLLYIAVLLLSVSSCRSIEKMVDKGQYDEAILFAAKKLHGEKNPKTKYVQGLEEAFEKVTQKDVDAISYMMKSGRTDQWDRIYDMYNKMEARQNSISPFLPLISKDGYKAEFRFLDLASLKLKAAEKATVYNYSRAEELLLGNKDDARTALSRLNRIDRYYTTYKNKEELKKEAEYKGTTRVSVEVVNQANAYIPFSVERQLKNLNLNGLGSRWVRYYYDNEHTNDIDVRAIININDIYVSPGTSRSNSFIEKATVSDGFVNKIGKKGKVLRDSLNQPIKIERFKDVEAQVVETWLSKSAEIRGRLIYLDIQTGREINSSPIDAIANFEEYGCEFQGSRKALSKDTKRKLRSLDNIYLPSSEDLLVDAGEVMKSEVLRLIRRQVY